MNERVSKTHLRRQSNSFKEKTRGLPGQTAGLKIVKGVKAKRTWLPPLEFLTSRTGKNQYDGPKPLFHTGRAITHAYLLEVDFCARQSENPPLWALDMDLRTLNIV